MNRNGKYAELIEDIIEYLIVHNCEIRHGDRVIRLFSEQYYDETVKPALFQMDRIAEFNKEMQEKTGSRNGNVQIEDRFAKFASFFNSDAVKSEMHEDGKKQDEESLTPQTIINIENLYLSDPSIIRDIVEKGIIKNIIVDSTLDASKIKEDIIHNPIIPDGTAVPLPYRKPRFSWKECKNCTSEYCNDTCPIYLKIKKSYNIPIGDKKE